MKNRNNQRFRQMYKLMEITKSHYVLSDRTNIASIAVYCKANKVLFPWDSFGSELLKMYYK